MWGGRARGKLASAPSERVLKDASGPRFLGSAGQEKGSSGRMLKEEVVQCKLYV